MKAGTGTGFVRWIAALLVAAAASGCATLDPVQGERLAADILLDVLDHHERDAVLLGRLGRREGHRATGVLLQAERRRLEHLRERGAARAVARQHADVREAIAQPRLEIGEFRDRALARRTVHQRLDGGVAAPAVGPTQGADAFDFHGSSNG